MTKKADCFDKSSPSINYRGEVAKKILAVYEARGKSRHI